MVQKRESQYELMRIVLMCMVPIFHLMIYNLMPFVEYNGSNTLLSIALSVGTGIPADYAYMALSAYFFIKMKDKPVVKRWLLLLFQVAFVYVIRFAFVRGIYGFDNPDYMIEGFIIPGAWWYIKAYLVISLIYPFLNYLIYKMSKKAYIAMLSILLLLFLVINYFKTPNFGSDMIAFLFTYFVMGFLMRFNGYERFLGIKTKPIYMFGIFLFVYIVLLLICIYVKHPRFGVDVQIAEDVIQYAINRYNIAGFVMGLSLFFGVRSIKIPFNKGINTLAKSTFYVFMLHETVMSAFWLNEWCWFPMQEYSLIKLIAWIIIYILAVYMVGIIICLIYEKILRKFVTKFVNYIMKKKAFDKLESLFHKIGTNNECK